MKEKRKRAIEFSKAGLEVPHTGQSSKKREDNSSSSESEQELEQMQLMIEQRVVLNTAAFQVDSPQNVNNGSPAASPDENILNENIGTCLREDKIFIPNDDTKCMNLTVWLLLFY